MKYIIDTDPGIDDAIAICLGVLNGLDIIGFTLSTGNVAKEQSENNLKIIEEFLQINKPIFRGSKQNKTHKSSAIYAHGHDGLGYSVFPKSKRVIERKSAEDFIIKSAKKYKDDLTLICLGPLTNIASVIKKEKNIAKYLKNIIIMGTSYNPKSKENYKEYNIKVDPCSAKLVFDTPFNNIKVITHEIGIKSYVKKDYVLSLRYSDSLISRFIGLISEKYIEFSKEHYNVNGLCSPDPTCIGYVIDNDILDFKPCKISIKANGKHKGECFINIEKNSNIKIAANVNVQKFNNLFKKTFN